MKYPYKTELETVAWLIFAHVPTDELPDQIHEIYRENDAGSIDSCIDCIYSYLKEAATEHFDAHNIEIPPYGE